MMSVMIKFLTKDIVTNTSAQTSNILLLGLLALALLVMIYEIIRKRKK